jgi:hypothetical protein
MRILIQEGDDQFLLAKKPSDEQYTEFDALVHPITRQAVIIRSRDFDRTTLSFLLER